MRYILVCKESDSCTMRYYVINLYMQPEDHERVNDRKQTCHPDAHTTIP